MKPLSDLCKAGEQHVEEIHLTREHCSKKDAPALSMSDKSGVHMTT